MPVRYFIGPLVDITIAGRSVRGSACLRYWSGPPSRVSIVKTAGGACLTRFEGEAQQITNANADADLFLLPDRTETPGGAARTAIRNRLAALGIDSSAISGDGRAIVQELARRITNVRAGALRMGPDDLNSAGF